MPRLIVLDLDGTLLPESKRIGARSLEVLGRIRDRGTEITLATGKFLHLSRTYADTLEIEAPLIALDGARVHHRGRTEERGIDRQQAVGLLEELIDPDWHAFADDGADGFLLRSSSPILARVARIWADQVREVEEMVPNLVADPGVIVAYGPGEEVEQRAARVRQRHPELRVSIVSSPMMDGARMTIQPADTSKGTAVESLLEQSAIDPGDCMVFGDWHNDVSMFEIGCVNVAMANAVPALLERADHTTELTSEDEGVADFLVRRYLG